jgi:hypothetical protein
MPVPFWASVLKQEDFSILVVWIYDKEVVRLAFAIQDVLYTSLSYVGEIFELSG